MSLKGSTKDFPLDVLIRLLADTKKTGELSLRGAGGEGALGLADGRVVTAVFADEPPIPALGAIFALGEAEFEFTPWEEAPPANLEGELGELLRKADEYRTWMASVREVIPTDNVRFRLSERAAEQGAVTFTSDRWRVVLAVNGQRDVNDLAAHLHIERDAALTVLAGLVRDGVIETVATPAETAAPAAAPSAPEAPPVSEPPPSSVMAAAPVEVAAEPEAAPVEPAPMEPPAEPERPALEWSATELGQPTEPPAPMAVEPPAQEWGELPATSETPAPVEPAAPVEWGAPAPPPEPEAPPAPPPAEWGAPAPAPEPEAPPAPPPAAWDAAPPAAQDWGAPAPAEPPPPVDDRLAALFGTPPSAPVETPPPAADQWSAPAAEAPAPAADDPRLGALTMPPLAPAPEPTAPEAPPQMPANEWAPPAAEAPAPPQKKGGLFGFFRREEPTPEPATRTTLVDRSASSRAGLLAAFSNALLTEYNSGHYGKSRVDDRIPNLLMRVDEQADPIDRPLPVVDDRLDVQALERVSPPEMQAVPYLALLVSTIYGDAEKAFGRDKAKRGYRAAQQHVFGGDPSALAGPDLAGKLPKI